MPPAHPSWLRPFLSAAAGLLLALAFISGSASGFAWVVPGIWLWCGAAPGRWRPLRVGYIGGLAFHLAALHWLTHIPVPVTPVAGWISLSLYLAFFPAVWLWVCWRCLPCNARVAQDGTWGQQTDAVLGMPWWQRTAWTLGCAASWVALEMLQARLLSGFPWNLLGISQYRLFPLTQIASITGVYGVSFLVAWTSLSLALAALRLLRQPAHQWGWMAELRLPLFVVLCVFCAGVLRSSKPVAPGREIQLALVQPAIPQEVIWDQREDAKRFARVLQLSQLAVATRPHLLVWPEAALPELTEENVRQVQELIQSNRIWMVLGAEDAEARPSAGPDGAYDYFNAAHLLAPDGRLRATYRKQQLVIFGEFVPLARWLPFLKRLTPVENGFRSGPGPVPFPIEAPRCVTSVLICFEDVFPHLVRRHVGIDTDFLLNLTNDGWFGNSAAQWQHAAAASFRAVENGRPLVRCTNNGLTCWYDSSGRLRQWLGENSGDPYRSGFLTICIPLPPAGQGQPLTFYTRHGDLFGWGCFSLTLVQLLGRPGRILRKRRAQLPT